MAVLPEATSPVGATIGQVIAQENKMARESAVEARGDALRVRDGLGVTQSPRDALRASLEVGGEGCSR